MAKLEVPRLLAKVEALARRAVAEALEALGVEATGAQVGLGSWLLIASIAYLALFYLLPSRVARRLIGVAIAWAWLWWALSLIPGP